MRACFLIQYGKAGEKGRASCKETGSRRNPEEKGKDKLCLVHAYKKKTPPVCAGRHVKNQSGDRHYLGAKPVNISRTSPLWLTSKTDFNSFGNVSTIYLAPFESVSMRTFENPRSMHRRTVASITCFPYPHLRYFGTT